MPRHIDDETRVYARQLLSDIVDHAEVEGQEAFLAEAFTDLILNDFEEEGLWPDYQLSYMAKRGVEVSAWGLDDLNGVLHLCVTDFTQSSDAITLPKSERQAIQKRLMNLFTYAKQEKIEPLEHNPVVDLVETIRSGEAFDSVRLLLLTNRITTPEAEVELNLAGHPATSRTWDLEAIRRSRQSGTWQEPIEVDFVARFGKGVPCLRSPDTFSDVDTLLVYMPGAVLADVYLHYGPRLLERNVRSFLMARGRINQGIRDTLRMEPERFLAYNNGITATASKVETRSGNGGGLEVTRISDLQIVNGGQTTASIAAAARDPEVELDAVSVQMKLAVVAPGLLDELVPNISRYANRQNAVQESDLSANHPFLRKIQTVSRTEWIPSSHGRPSKWYFERARGSYAVEKSEAGTPAKQRQFTDGYPPSQKFGKNELALFENAWSNMPHIVCRGGQKSFAEFMQNLPDVAEGDEEEAQKQYRNIFQELVAKAILFKTTDKLVRAELGGTYKRQIVAYTLAYFLDRHRDAVDLALIWRTQQVDEPVKTALTQIAASIKDSIISTGVGWNITEWTKQEECWTTINEMSFDYTRPPAGGSIAEVASAPNGQGSDASPNGKPGSSTRAKSRGSATTRGRGTTLAKAIESVFGESIQGSWARFRRPKWHHIGDTGIETPDGRATYHLFEADFSNERGPYTLEVAVDFPSRAIVPVDKLRPNVQTQVRDWLVTK